MARLEFYVSGNDRHIAVVRDGAVPRVGDLVSIRKTTYEVTSVTWAVDHADEYPAAELRANIDIELVDTPPAPLK